MTSDEHRSLHAVVSGRVQGVFYRATTRQHAERLGLTGWVRNLPDGRVELHAEGPEPRLLELLEACRQGPPGARVTAVDERWGPATGQWVRFEVTR